MTPHTNIVHQSPTPSVEEALRAATKGPHVSESIRELCKAISEGDFPQAQMLADNSRQKISQAILDLRLEMDSIDRFMNVFDFDKAGTNKQEGDGDG